MTSTRGDTDGAGNTADTTLALPRRLVRDLVKMGMLCFFVASTAGLAVAMPFVYFRDRDSHTPETSLTTVFNCQGLPPKQTQNGYSVLITNGGIGNETKYLQYYWDERAPRGKVIYDGIIHRKAD